jgi:choline dehydrogenase-like flavoprotein
MEENWYLTGTIYGLEKIRDRREVYSLVTHDVVENADICIIGSGAAGAIIAQKLAQEGKSVVLLEKGGYYDAEDMNQREVDMMPLLWKNGGATFTDNLRMVIAQGQCLGGSTVINDAVCFKTPVVVRDEWRAMGVSIPEEQWAKAADDVWNNLKVGKVKPYELNENNTMLKRACELKGYKSSENDRNCVDCMQCGLCHIGCHYETKQDVLVTYIRKALRDPSSNIRIYCNCSAERITYSGTEANGVEGDFIGRDGNVVFKIRVNARVVIVCAGAIASSQILLANSIATGRAGRGLSFHPASFLLGRFANEINAYNGIPMAYTCHEFGVTNGVQNGGFLIESIFLPIFQFSLGIPSFVEEHSNLMKDYVHYAMAGVMIRDDSGGSLSLTSSGKPRVHYEPSIKDIKTFAKGLQILAEMWFDVGANEVITGHRDVIRLARREEISKLVDAIEKNPSGLQLASAHPQGGNRMGDDPTVCVVDSNCRVHGFENLYVCDASVFPTAVGVNPQITVMTLATITADKINKEWSKLEAIDLGKSLGESCSIAQPMYCSIERLEVMFNRSMNQLPIETITNAENASDDPTTWSFNKDTLMIYNNKHWKGFFPIDQQVAPMRYFGGFWKRFFKKGGTLQGVTHPYDAPVYADNIPQLIDHPRFGQVIHLKYTGPEYAMFYDLLKIVDKDTILGKAFFGIAPGGSQLLVFSMSRKYNVDFMSEEDHETIFVAYGRSPQAEEVIGRWVGKLVSDSALTPDVQVFTYTRDNFGKLQMQYIFGNLLSGISRVELTSDHMRMYDFTNWHDEVKMITNDFMVGKWCSPAFELDIESAAPSFLDVEEVSEGKRLCLRFTLKRRC